MLNSVIRQLQRKWLRHIPERSRTHCGHAVLRCFVILALCWRPFAASAQTDSSAIYERIDEFAKKRKFTRVLYDAIFVEPAHAADESPATHKKQVPKDHFARYKGRTIRSIHIHVLDPFATDVRDTIVRPTNWLERVGNGAHITTREFVVKGVLLFKAGDALDPLELRESERLLRTYSLANDALITVLPADGGEREVDVLVVVQDRWSLEVAASGDLNGANVQIEENNLLGMGQLLEQEVGYDLSRSRPVLKGAHRVYNFGESHMGSTLRYMASQELDQVLLSLDRPFFSPLTKWAGNATISHTWYRPDMDPRYTVQRHGTLQTTRYDLWGGVSLKANSDTTEKARSENVVLATRYIDQAYRVSGPLSDSLRYSDDRTALVSIQFSEQLFVKDKYLYRFGSAEDVALGRLLSFTTGAVWIPGKAPLPYSGISASYATSTENGRYTMLSVGVGSFWRNARSTNAVASVSLYGFTSLLELGKWKVRQFMTATYAKSIRPSSPMSLDLAGDQLARMNAYGWYGDQKLLLRMETVGYAPLSVFGFRFAPVLVVALGTLGSEHEALYTTTYRGTIGLGLLIRNERLLSNTFRVSFAFYPGLPPELGDQFRYNALNSLRLRSPSLAPGAPDLVGIP